MMSAVMIVESDEVILKIRDLVAWGVLGFHAIRIKVSMQGRFFILS